MFKELEWGITFGESRIRQTGKAPTRKVGTNLILWPNKIGPQGDATAKGKSF